eukprot:3436963-Pyramimonas_sp.AAC.1
MRADLRHYVVSSPHPLLQPQLARLSMRRITYSLLLAVATAAAASPMIAMLLPAPHLDSFQNRL